MSVAQSVAALNFLCEQIAAALPGNWPVYVGSPASQGDLPPRYIAVAYGGEDRPGISGEASLQDSTRPNASGHQWWVWLTASCASGDVDGFARLSEVEAVYDAFEDALEANRYLDTGSGPLLQGGSVAQLGSHEWIVEDDGTVATVFWVVQIDWSGW